MSFFLSRRMVLGTFVAATIAGLTSAIAQLPSPETRVVVDDLGHEVTIPVRPLRIVAIQGAQIAAPLIELGAPIAGATGVSNPFINAEQPYIRGAYETLDFRFETSEIVWIGDDGNFDIEAVVAARPDLIIGPAFPTANRYDQLVQIAPTVLIDVSGALATPIERYRRIADLAGRLDVFLEMEARWEERLARARTIMADTIPDPSRIVVSHIDATASRIRIVRNFGLLGEMIETLGFSYPPITADAPAQNPGGGQGELTVSAELLPMLQTDFLLTPLQVFSTPGGTIAGTIPVALQNFEALAPGWTAFVHAARNRQHLFFDSALLSTNTFESRRNALDFLMTNIVMRPFVPVDENAPRVPARPTAPN